MVAIFYTMQICLLTPEKGGQGKGGIIQKATKLYNICSTMNEGRIYLGLARVIGDTL